MYMNKYSNKYIFINITNLRLVNPSFAHRLLHECVQPTKSTVDVEDVHPLMAAINNEPVGAEIVSNFVLDNWKELTER